MERRPRSPLAISPASKLSATRRVSASPSASNRRSTSAALGTASVKGHHISTASKPAAATNFGRASNGNSVKIIEMLTSNDNEPDFSMIRKLRSALQKPAYPTRFATSSQKSKFHFNFPVTRENHSAYPAYDDGDPQVSEARPIVKVWVESDGRMA